MIRPPTPEQKEVQPIYNRHSVSITKEGKAEIVLTYSLQNQREWNAVEKYLYDGQTISLVSRAYTGAVLGHATVADEKTNWHIDLVLANLKDRAYRPPAGDFIVLALQPMGTASDTVVYELDAAQLVIVPGTNQDKSTVRTQLTREKISLLRELVTMQAIQSLARDSGQFGLDGTALVAVVKTGQKIKFIGHWGAPSPAIELLYALHARELQYRQTLLKK